MIVLSHTIEPLFLICNFSSFFTLLFFVKKRRNGEKKGERKKIRNRIMKFSLERVVKHYGFSLTLSSLKIKTFCQFNWPLEIFCQKFFSMLDLCSMTSYSVCLKCMRMNTLLSE